MLKLKKISKDYQVANDEVHALIDVDLNFRKNEFVSILGPSGSGKTTLLNIIGGLDKYSSGDLIIAGKSTKDFKDRDWDFYRNQRIGFIFQSYNLIPHQTVLSNVELALTISGVKKDEITRRAKEALDKVGLSDQYYKKPNQLSGGQCQRVAIARALVNNPEILLADEPTGALDTKTSTQIMELIKEISKDRLVIMVTHNPDLADQYSNRIINLLDGRIVSDTNPYSDELEEKEVHELSAEQIEKVSKAKMNLSTTMKLSFKNLLSKRKRTILVSIASSIGIIGVSTVLAVSFGVTNYVTGMQDDMLSSYPIEVAEQSVDLTSLVSGLTSSAKKELAQFDIKTQVGMESLITYLMEKYSDVTSVKTNDINENLVNFVKEIPIKDLASVHYQYGIDPTNNIFTPWVNSKTEGEQSSYVSVNGLTQRYISELKTVGGFETYASYVNLFTSFMKEIPGSDDYVLNQYELLGNSTYATKEDEMMLVVSKDTTLTDLLLGQMGFYNHDEFISIGRRAVEIYRTDKDPRKGGLKQKLDANIITKAEYDEAIKLLDAKFPYRRIFNYTDLIGKELYYIPHQTLWEWNNSVSDDTQMQGTMLVIGNDANKKIYSFQYAYISLVNADVLSGYEIDITTGQSKTHNFYRFPASESRDPNSFLDGTWFEVTDVSAMATILNLFNKISAKVGPEASVTQVFAYILSHQDDPDVKELLSYIGDVMTVKDNVSSVLFTNLSTKKTTTYTNIVSHMQETDTVSGYSFNIGLKDEWKQNPEQYGGFKIKISGILRAKQSTNFGCLSRGIYYTQAFGERYRADANKSDLVNNPDPNKGFKAYLNSPNGLTKVYGAYVTYPYIDFSKDEDNPIVRTDGYANALNGNLQDSFSALFSSITGMVSYSDTNIVHFRSVCGLKPVLDSETTQYTFENLPVQMDIYPKDFASKNNITKYLDTWNSDGSITVAGKEIKRSERTDISYTDTVATIINVINLLITIVTSALVAFTSLSLVVSCFMIAVITYISVMERIKEIGVIRSLGGRKRDVSRLFTAENFMTGLTSGVIGIVACYLISIIINVIVKFFGAPGIAALPWWMAILMILLSIMLSVISGFIPSKNAARQDPVNALRSE